MRSICSPRYGHVKSSKCSGPGLEMVTGLNTHVLVKHIGIRQLLYIIQMFYRRRFGKSSTFGSPIGTSSLNLSQQWSNLPNLTMHLSHNPHTALENIAVPVYLGIRDRSIVGFVRLVYCKFNTQIISHNTPQTST